MYRYKTLLLLVLTVCCLAACSTDSRQEPASNWKEVEALNTPNYASAARVKYNPDDYIHDEAFIFRGTISESKEIEISWRDETDAAWGPYYYSVHEVAISRVFGGNYADESIRMISYNSSHMQIDDDFLLQAGKEYIFFTKFISEEEHIKEPGLDSPMRLYDHADVYLTGALYGLIAIENDYIAIYEGLSDLMKLDESVAARDIHRIQNNTEYFKDRMTLINGSSVNEDTFEIDGLDSKLVAQVIAGEVSVPSVANVPRLETARIAPLAGVESALQTIVAQMMGQ